MLYRQASVTRRAVDIIDVIHKLDVEALVLSLDPEKTFGRLSWTFLWAILNRVVVRGPFLRAIMPCILALLQKLSSPMPPQRHLPSIMAPGRGVLCHTSFLPSA